jgi:hypothetical protein
MYLLDYKHPTELFSERREALMREARDAHLARELREARSNWEEAQPIEGVRSANNRPLGTDERPILQGLENPEQRRDREPIQ